MSLLVDWAFEELELERIEITTTPDNAAARALARSLGFERGRRDDRAAIWSADGGSMWCSWPVCASNGDGSRLSR